MFDFLSNTDFPYFLMQRASLRGRDYAWPLQLIPRVIRHVQDLGGISLGGRVQLRLPDGLTLAIAGAEVSTASAVARASRADRVRLSAEAALRQFHALPSPDDLIATARAAQGARLDALGLTREDLQQAMCMVWSVQQAKGKRA